MGEKVMVERRFKTEKAAFWARHKDIANGWKVSLIAFDPERELYVYDLYW